MKISKQKLKNLRKAKSKVNSQGIEKVVVDDSNIDQFMTGEIGSYDDIVMGSSPEELALVRQRYAISHYGNIPVEYHDARLPLIDHIGDDVQIQGFVSDIQKSGDTYRICIDAPQLTAVMTKYETDFKPIKRHNSIGSHIWIMLDKVESIHRSIEYISIGDVIVVGGLVKMYNYHKSSRQNVGIDNVRIMSDGVPIAYNRRSTAVKTLRNDYPRHGDWIIKVNRRVSSVDHDLLKSKYHFSDKLCKHTDYLINLGAAINYYLEIRDSAYNSLAHPDRIDVNSNIPVTQQVKNNIAKFDERYNHAPDQKLLDQIQTLSNTADQLIEKTPKSSGKYDSMIAVKYFNDELLKCIKNTKILKGIAYRLH